MSWEQPTYSFGNPNAQPPTPTKTPISPHFPSPTFQTPRNNNNSTFEDRGGWTPQFAEEYSVFNSTPGRLTSAQHHSFVDVSTPRPSTIAGQKLPLSSPGDFSAEFGTHATHLSPHPNIHQVSPSNELPSSSAPYSTNYTRSDDSSKNKVTPSKPKKRLDEAFSGQTATPPPTSKGSRKLAPKLQTSTMHNEPLDSHYGSSQTPTHPTIMSFTSSSDMFNYPMSAPATASAFDNTKSFWDPDTSMNGMDIDFTAHDALFNNGGHRVSNSVDWGRSNQVFQDSMNMPSQQPEQKLSKRQRPLAPKVAIPDVEIPISMAPFDFHNASAADDPFSASTLDGAVDPGLLFSRSNSINIPAGFEGVTLPPSRPVTSYALIEPYQHQLREASRDREELRRSRSYRDGGKVRRYDRGTVSSPVKGSARPGLYRSVSEVRGKISQDRARPRTGRISPVKQQRPPSLSSIPELPPTRSRTEVRFTIDANGRAKTETVVIQEKPPMPSRGGRSGSRERWESSSTDSSSDDEPIIVPSRNTSFTIPPQGKGPKMATFDTSHRGADVRRHSTSGYSQSESSSQQSLHFDSVESEAETVVDEDDGSGDATLELKRLMESRKQRQIMKARTPRHHHYSSSRTRGGSRHTNYSSSTNLSPTTITDPDGATPLSSRSGSTRCVCNNPDSEGFMIQCESCDNWLHAECVGIDRRGLPPVYICAFCANTPNMRGGRLRETGRAVPTAHLGSSPLAHKSFKSFR